MKEPKIGDSQGHENPIRDAREAVFHENGSITAQVKFNGSDKWVPFTTAAWHTEEYGRQLFSDLKAGKYGSVTPFTPDSRTLDIARKYKLCQIDRWREVEEEKGGIVQHEGRRWDYDRRTRERLRLTLANAETLPEKFTWRDADNNETEVTPESLLELVCAVDRAMFNTSTLAHRRQLQMKSDVAGLISLSQIREYTVGWGENAGTLNPEHSFL